MIEVKTTDSYEASFYLMKGAQLVSYQNKPIAPNDIRRYGISRQWIFILNGVSQRDFEAWKNHKAWGNLRLFQSARKRLKRMMSKFS